MSPEPTGASVDNDPLASAWTRYRGAGPGTHARDFARTLGLREAQLLDLGRGRGTSRLQPKFEELFAALPALGAVKSMTRNEQIVLEHWGRYHGEGGDTGPEAEKDPGIDLRIFFRHWGSAFAVREGANDSRLSIQFFDKSGDSVHKLYLEDTSKIPAYEALVARFRDDGAEPLSVAPPPAPPKPDAPIDAAAFQAEWDALKDTHEFVMLLARNKLPRVEALRLAGPTRATEVSQSSLRVLLESLATTQTPFMIFVGSRGLMQIFTGTVRAVKAQNGWVNVFDKGLNLHAREAGIASSFIVKKPTADGIVTSLELYDAAGDTLAFLFGERSFGQPESTEWRARLAELTPV